MDRMHRRAIIIAHIPGPEYQRFRECIGRDPRVPAEYADWLNGSLYTERIHKSAAWPTRRVTVHIEEFVAFAGKAGVAPSYALLNTFACLCARRGR